MAWTEIFRAGDYPQGTFSATDLDQVIANYDPARHEAPLVIGHPQTDSPAFGWVESLRRAGEVLLAQFRQVPPTLRAAVDAGRWKKVSVRLRRDPERGWELRHVGLLGAAAPAVEGLGPIQFDEQGEGVQLEVDFSQKEATVPTAEEIRAEVEAEFSAKFADREREFQAELAAERQKGRRRDMEAFVADQIKEGRLTPAQRDSGLVDFMLRLDGAQEVEFAAGAKATAAAWFEGFLKGLPLVVNFQALAGPGSDPGATTKDFASPKGEHVDAERLALHQKAVAHQRANNCSYEQALAAVI
ncbi:MAG: hypothetical protein AMXMBFR64_62100 [Myxococcales bacterium]